MKLFFAFSKLFKIFVFIFNISLVNKKYLLLPNVDTH